MSTSQRPTARLDLCPLIDHTSLGPDLRRSDVGLLCEQAKTYRFHGVCVNSSWVAPCTSLLEGSSTAIVSTIGFPLGAPSTASKLSEARQALADGATELDVVMNIGRFLDGETDYVVREVTELASIAHSDGAILKMIIETGLLTGSQIADASSAVKLGGSDFVKTCTGFGPRGATVNDVEVIRRAVGPTMGVKASGGIRTASQALELIRAGANRLGCSRSVELLTSQ